MANNPVQVTSLIKELEDRLSKVAPGQIYNDLYRKTIEGTIEKLKNGYYDSLDEYRPSDQLSRDLKSLGFHDLARQVEVIY